MNAFAFGAQPDRDFRSRILHAWLLLGAVLLLCGCPAAAPPTKPTTTSTPAAKAKKMGAASALCVDSFERAVSIVQPESLGIDTDPKTAIALLNEWVTYCSPEGGIDVGLEEVKSTFLSGPQWEAGKARLEHDLFDLRDTRHLRDAYLFRQIGEKLAQQHENDLARVNGFFDYACTNIALDPSLTGSTPHTGFEALLWGLGSPADRAWVFLAILQQMKFEAIILTFEDVQLAAYGHPYLLVGVPIADQVYLYDPMIAMPLPHDVVARNNEATGASDWGQATWSQFTGEGFWKPFDQIQLGHPLKDIQPSAAEAWLYGTSSGWSARMQEFESLLRGEQVVVLFDPLVDIKGKTSLIAQGLPARVRAGLPEGTLPEFAGVWGYPEVMINAFAEPSDAQRQQIAGRMQPFLTASTIVTASTSQRTGSEDGKHQDVAYDYSQSSELKYYQARLAQLQQDFENSIAAYIKLSLNVPKTLSSRADIIQMIMAQDANYWLGLCQFEQEHYGVAGDSLRRYLDQFGRDGRWFQASLINYCKALRASGKADEATAFINQVTLDSPQVQEAVYLMKKWQPAKPAEPASEPAPSEPATTTPPSSPAPASTNLDASTTSSTPPPGEASASPAPSEPAPATPAD